MLTVEKRDYKNFLISEWFVKFKQKDERKNETINLKILLILKNSVNLKENPG